MEAQKLNVFIDTSIVNNILDIEDDGSTNTMTQKDLEYLKLLLEGPVMAGNITFYVNPSIRLQIDETPDKQRRERLVSKFGEFHFTEYNLTIFPFTFPATFISEGQAASIENLCKVHPALDRDKKIIADAAFNDNINVMLTTDKNLAHQVREIGKVKFMLPEELCRSLEIV